VHAYICPIKLGANNPLTDNDGRWLGYRMAKAALNSQTRSLAGELKAAGFNIAVVAVAPGVVATRLTDFNFIDDIDEAMPGMFSVIEKVTMENTGDFINWDGVKMNL
jgi:NAD(P)-dependent dehydrogenase (short-subunit alcohol dehydrogenase family)